MIFKQIYVNMEIIIKTISNGYIISVNDEIMFVETFKEAVDIVKSLKVEK